MLRKIFLTVLLLVAICARAAQAGQNECGGVSYLGNPYDCQSICLNDGNCVWWGYAQRPDLYPPLNANSPVDLWPVAVNAGLTDSQPKVGSLVYLDDTKVRYPGHIAYVQYVNSDNSIEVSEMACYEWYGVQYHRYSLSQVSGFIYGGPVPFYEQRSVSGAINWREATLLTIYNPYSGHTPDHQPLAVFGPRDQWGMHWYHVYNIASQNKFFSDGTPKNCKIQGYVGRSGGKSWDGAIVYDVLGGAKSAYVVGWQQWDVWHELLPYGDPEFNPGDGGPNSCLGMPITNSYWTGSVWRQDFQKGYLLYGTVHSYGDDGAQCAPGWSTSGWNHRYSYLFAEAYERNGAAVRVGKAIPGDFGKVHVLSGNILIQDFSSGNDGAGMIMYDQENWDCNTGATNEAYWVYGDIKARYDQLGVSYYGCATIDRFYLNGKWCQDFKNSAGTRYRIYETGSPTVDLLGTCSGGSYMAAGSGGSSESFSGLTLTPIAGDWNGDGICEVGVYAAENRTFYLDADNDGYTDTEITTGNSGDKPLVGDWNGNNYWTIGIYRPSTRTFWLDHNNDGVADFARTYGNPGDVPVLGDWNGNGQMTIGIYRPSTRTFWLDHNNDGVADFARTYGNPGDVPVLGDWNGNNYWTIGIYRPSTRTFWLDHNNDGVADFARTYGNPGDVPVLGDWNGNGQMTIGIYRPSTRTFWLDHNNDGGADRSIHIKRLVGASKVMSSIDNNLPTSFNLKQNYPNPFNPATTISYSLSKATLVTLDIFNILGQKVETLVDESQGAGEYTISWATHQQASGIYFYRLTTGEAVETKKMVLLK